MGMLKIVKQLPIADINSKNMVGYTPLHFASMNGKTSTCVWLLQNGADVNAVTSLNETPLDLAVENKYPVTELFLEDYMSKQVTKIFTRILPCITPNNEWWSLLLQKMWAGKEFPLPHCIVASFKIYVFFNTKFLQT
jgi:ankyrin repeat protein